MKKLIIIGLLLSSPALADDYDPHVQLMDEIRQQQQQETAAWDRATEQRQMQQQIQDLRSQQHDLQYQIEEQNGRAQMQRDGRPMYPNF